MKASIHKLIKENPSGLLEIKKSLSITEYRDNYGFDLNMATEIFKSKKITNHNQDWYRFGHRPLDELFKVQEESNGDLLVVFIIETIKANRVYCQLVLKDQSFREILNDKNIHLLQVQQMYSKYIFEPYSLNLVQK